MFAIATGIDTSCGSVSLTLGKVLMAVNPLAVLVACLKYTSWPLKCLVPVVGRASPVGA